MVTVRPRRKLQIANVDQIRDYKSSPTRPCLLSRQREAAALRMGVADVRSLSGAVHRQNAALLTVGRPAAVFHIP